MVLLNVNNVSALESVDQQDQGTISKSSECDKKIKKNKKKQKKPTDHKFKFSIQGSRSLVSVHKRLKKDWNPLMEGKDSN